MVNADDIVVLRDIAARLGVDYNTVYSWNRRRNTNGFPEPIKIVGTEWSKRSGKNVMNYDILLFDWNEVIEWHQQRYATKE